MTNSIEDLQPRTIARIAGFLYLSFIVLMATANVVGRTGIIVDGDAAATAANIIAKGMRFRIGFVCDLLSALFFLLTAWALYALLKEVNRTLALLFLLLNMCGVAMQCFSMILLYAALPLLNGGGYLAVFSTEQLNAQAMFFLAAGELSSFMTGQALIVDGGATARLSTE